jgi:hypothetical protein
MIRLPPLGDRKPSVMLAEMLEYCPVGESTTAIFAFLFYSGFPRKSGSCYPRMTLPT